MNFHTRGQMIEEQVEVMRLLWSQYVVSYTGRFHTITEAGLNPLPIGHSIPIWMGGENWEQHIFLLTRWVRASSLSTSTLMLSVDTKKP